MYESIIEAVQMALVVVVTTGVFASAVMELIKQVAEAISGLQWKVPSEWMTLSTSIISSAATFYILAESGIGIFPALMAAVVAVFTPKIAHDIVRRQTYDKELSESRKKTIEGGE